MKYGRMRRGAVLPGVAGMTWHAVIVAATIGVLSVDAHASVVSHLVDQSMTAVSREPALLAVADVIAMGQESDWYPTENVGELWAQLVDALEDPTAAEMARYMYARHQMATADYDDVIAVEAEFGFIDTWCVVGPFANDGMSGLSTAYRPELEGWDPTAEYDGKSTTVRWRQFARASETGYLDLGDITRPYQSALTYVASEVTVDADFTGVLALAVDGAYRVWIDGEPIGEQPNHLGGFFERDRIAVTLEEGTHQILIKIGTEDSAMGLHARLLDADGRPAEFAQRAVQMQGVVASAPVAEWPAVETIADRLSEVLTANSDATANAAAAFAVRRLMPADPNESWLEFSEIALAGDPDAESLVWLSDVVTEHWRAVELLDRARALAPDSWLELAWIRAHEHQMGTSSAGLARDALLSLLDREPQNVRARLHYARLLRAEGFYFSAFDELQRLAADADVPEVLYDLEGAAYELHREDMLPSLNDQLIDRGRSNVATYRSALQLWRVRGEIDRAEEALEELLERLPLTIEVHRLAADHHRALGNGAAAIDALTVALSLCPGAAALYEDRGRLRLEAGDHEGAADDFEAALVLRPQDSELRDYLTQIRPAGADFFEDYRLTLEELQDLRSGAEAPEDADFAYVADQKITRVFDNGLATTYVQQAYDVFSRTGADDLRSVSLAYSPDSEIVEVLSVRIVKADGTVREAYQSDDRAAYSGPSSIYYDVRTRAIYFPSLEEGDLLTYEYTVADVSYRNLFDDYFGDFWFLQDHQAKYYARYAVIAPDDRPIHTNEPAGGFGAWTVEEGEDEWTYSYVAEMVPRVPRESGSPGPSEIFDYISVSTYSSWDTLADWYWNLIEDQLVVSPPIAAMVDELIEGVDDEREMVARIHNYVVRNTRYVGLEFGIHGYKPYRTSDCFNRRFGDCKDTASLMKVMLNYAGIDAHLVLTRTRDLGNLDGQPPSLALFNHAITYVPAFDLYLDGTAGFSGSDELPSMDQGATAVVILDGNGAMPTTIGMHDAESTLSLTEMDVDLSGDLATGTGRMVLEGDFAPWARRQFEAAEQRTERLQQYMSRQLPGIEVSEAEFNDLTDIEVPFEVQFALSGGEWARRQGDSVVVQPLGSDSRLTAQLAPSSERTLPLEFDSAYSVRETYRIRVPETFEAESIPGSVTLDSRFGTMDLSVVFEASVLTTDLSLSLSATEVAPDDYPEFRQFVIDIEAALDRVARFRDPVAEEVAQ